MNGGKRGAALALYADCGDLVVSFGIEEISRVLLGDGLRRLAVDPDAKLGGVLFDEHPIPAWDLAQLLGLRKASSAGVWIVIATFIAGAPRTFALACDRSIAVRPQQLHLPLSLRLFASRPGAVVAAFETTVLGDGAGLAPTGFALSAAHLLAGEELRAVAAAAAQGKVKW